MVASSVTYVKGICTSEPRTYWLLFPRLRAFLRLTQAYRNEIRWAQVWQAPVQPLKLRPVVTTRAAVRSHSPSPTPMGKALTRIPHIDLINVPENRRDAGENADLCFHPSRTARFDRPPTAIYLICLSESGP